MLNSKEASLKDYSKKSLLDNCDSDGNNISNFLLTNERRYDE